jgi:hypothetical protein
MVRNKENLHIFNSSNIYIYGARGSVVGWGTTLQAALRPGVDSASNRMEYNEFSCG